MNFKFVKGDTTKEDLYEIFHIDRTFYKDEDYLLTPEDYEGRLRANGNIYYVARTNTNVIVGYVSMIPVCYDAYLELKNGKLDKNVLTPNAIISNADEVNYIYWDSIVILQKYRKYKLGRKLFSFVFNDVIASYPNLQRILSRTITPGGYKLASRKGLIPKRSIGEHTIIVEKILNRKPKRIKKLYRNNHKKQIELKDKSWKFF